MLLNLDQLMMNTPKSILYVIEIQSKLKEIDMAIERFLTEAQSIYNKTLTNSSHGEGNISNGLKLMSNTCKYRSACNGHDCSEGDERKKSKVLSGNLSMINLPYFVFSNENSTRSCLPNSSA